MTSGLKLSTAFQSLMLKPPGNWLNNFLMYVPLSLISLREDAGQKTLLLTYLCFVGNKGR